MKHASLRDEFPPRAVSGVEPGEGLRIGTYISIVRQQVRLQHEYPGEAFYLIADYHALSQTSSHSNIVRQSSEAAMAYLALGVDPDKALMYRQSDVPQLFELLWLVSCFAPPRLTPTSAALMEQGAFNSNIGAVMYPLLMAVDLLGLRATTGFGFATDAERFEYGRDLAASLNERLGGPLFPVAQIAMPPSDEFPPPTGQPIQLTNGPSVFADEDQIHLWVAAIAAHAESPGGRELWNWLNRLYERAVGAAGAGAVEGSPQDPAVQRELASRLGGFLAPFRDERRRLAGNLDLVEEVLSAGGERARQEFREAVELVRERAGMGRYRRWSLAGR